jgi:hypothetical protein
MSKNGEIKKRLRKNKCRKDKISMNFKQVRGNFYISSAEYRPGKGCFKHNNISLCDTKWEEFIVSRSNNNIHSKLFLFPLFI